MGETIRSSIAEVKTTARRMVIAWACLMSFAFVIFLLLIFGSLDYFLRYQDPGVRYSLCAFSFVGLSGTIYLFFRSFVRSRMSDLEISQVIDARFPDLNGELSSAYSFLSNDQSFESETLRHSVIERVEGNLGRINIADTFDLRALYRAIGFATLALASLIAIFCVESSLISTGFKRILLPWTSTEWPRTNDLYFEDLPEKLSQGENLDILVRDRNGALTTTVQLYFMQAGDSSLDYLSLQVINGTARHHLDSVQRSVFVRAIGGDGATDWHQILVAPAPKLSDLQFELVPPAYSKFALRKTTAPLTALKGSKLRISGLASEPLKRVVLLFTKEQQAQRKEIDANGSEKFKFPQDRSAPYELDEPVTLKVLLENESGMVGGQSQSYQINVKPDHPPVPELSLPESIGFTTPNGSIKLSINVTEDVRLESVSLYAKINQSNQTTIRPVFERDANSEKQLVKKDSSSDGNEKLELQLPLSVSDLATLKAGDTIRFAITAKDAFGNESSSNPVTIRIETQGELVRRLLNQQSQIFDQIKIALKEQKRAQKMVSSAKSRDEFAYPNLRQAKDVQQAVHRVLFAEEIGVADRLSTLIEQAESNLESHENFTAQVKSLKTKIDALQPQPLTELKTTFESSLSLARAAQRTNRESASLDRDRSVSHIKKLQTEAIAKLEEIFGQTKQIDEVRSLVDKIEKVRQAESEIVSRLERIQPLTLGQSFAQLSQKTKAQLRQTSDMQNEYAREMQTIVTMASKLASSPEGQFQSAQREQLKAAVKFLQTAAIESRMQSAASQITQNQLGKALLESEKILEDLRELLKKLGAESQNNSNKRLDSARENSDSIDQLIERQSKIDDRLNDDRNLNSTEFSKLSSQQTEIASSLENFAKADSIEPEIRDFVEQLSGKANTVANELLQENQEQSKQLSKEIYKGLIDLKSKFDSRIAEEKRKQQKARNDDAVEKLTTIIRMQKQQIAKVQSLPAETDTDAPAIVEIANSEKELGERVSDLALVFADQIAIAWVLDSAAEDLNDIAQKLRQKDSQLILPQMKSVLASLEIVLGTLETKNETTNQQKNNPLNNNQKAKSDSAEQGISPAAVKLLVARQKAILLESESIQLAIDRGEPTDPTRLIRLHEQEQELLDVVTRYVDRLEKTQPETEPGLDPSKIPDIPDLPDLPDF